MPGTYMYNVPISNTRHAVICPMESRGISVNEIII